MNNHGVAIPVREEDRWTLQGSGDLPLIYELKPSAMPAIFHIKVTSGNLANVQGLNIASARGEDKVGDIIHVFNPHGQKIDLHVAATVETPFAPLYGSLLMNYASFPDANTLYNNPDVDDLFSSRHYTMLYTGVTAQELHRLGINTLAFPQWVHARVGKMLHKRGGQFDILFAPILAVCLALVVVNSLNFSAKSRNIRKTISILGGSRWQDIYIIFTEFIAIFLITFLLTPLENLIANKSSAGISFEQYKVHIAFDYPGKQIMIIAVLLILGVALPPIIKILCTHRMRFGKIKVSLF